MIKFNVLEPYKLDQCPRQQLGVTNPVFRGINRANKRQLIMRINLIALIMIAFLLNVSASVSFAQKLTLNEQRAPLKKVFDEVRKQTGYAVFYKSGHVKNAKPVTVNISDVPLEEAMTKILEGQELDFSIDEKTVVIREKEVVEKVKDFFVAGSDKSVPTQQNIHGTVTDSLGQPLEGASVRAVNAEGRRTALQTTTGKDGTFTLQNVPKDATLEISFVGYTTKQVPAAANLGTIILSLGASDLDEVVVIGYGSTRKQDLSMAVTTVKLDQVMKSRPGASIGALLQGKVPGMTIQSDGGDPLRGQTITIRGKGSRDDDGVLWIVDGVPGAPYSLEDVETVTVLKDAASAAIYGAQVGAGGVIVITTKKAQAGKIKIEANVSHGIKSAYKLPEAVTAEQYMQLWDAAINSSTGNRTLAPAQDPVAYPYGAVTRTNWVDEVFRTANVQHYAVSLSGGSETLKALGSFSYDKNEGTLLNTFSNLMNGKLNLEFQPAKWLKITERGSFSYSNGQGNVDNFGHGGVLMQSIFYPRSATIYEHNPDGTIATDSEGNLLFGGLFPVANPQGVFSGYGETRNPVAALLRLRMNRPNGTIHSTTGLDIKPISSITLHSDFTAYLNPGREERFYPKAYELGAAGDTDNERIVSSYWNRGWLSETTATFAEQFGEHSISAMAGFTARYSTGRGNRADVVNFAKEDEYYTILGNADNYIKYRPEEWINEEALVSAMGRIGYSYHDRYFATASVRRDASSKLAPENNSGVFSAFSASWKISSEEFFDVEAINLLKLRAGWGQIGNINTVPNYSYFAGLRTSEYPVSLGDNYMGYYGTYVATIPNRQLTWETSEQTSIGLDATLFNHSLNITLDYFNKITKDLIDTKPLPPMAGYVSDPMGNIGRVSNKGWEFSADYTKTFGDLAFNLSGNVSSVKSEVLEFNNGKIYTHGDFGNSGPAPLRSEVGQPWYSYKLIKTDGIFQSQAEVDAHVNKDGIKIQPNAAPGDLKFVDLDGNGNINDDDRQYMGSYLPELTYSFGAGLTYKSFDFNAFFQGISGVKIFNGFKSLGLNGRGQGHYFLSDAMDNWTLDHSSKNPRLTLFEDPNGNLKVASDYLLEDGSYLRLKYVTLGYTLPKSWMTRGASGSKIRLYVASENLLTFTKYSGFDPEVGNRGIDGGTYPVARTFNFGVNIDF
ncbi:TonB-dependent receptor [Parapedobacter sp. DT-150]|uniref:TonB-dependent receptor n=1 Tax=Parapedobacter sp. DT-150 TaxID=3396162 RepID=UPI003F1963DC